MKPLIYLFIFAGGGTVIYLLIIQPLYQYFFKSTNRSKMSEQNGAMYNMSICLSDIPKEDIKKANNGKLYVNIVVADRKEPDNYGNDATAFMSQTKAQREAKSPKKYIGQGTKVKIGQGTPLAANDPHPFAAGDANPQGALTTGNQQQNNEQWMQQGKPVDNGNAGPIPEFVTLPSGEKIKNLDGKRYQKQDGSICGPNGNPLDENNDELPF